MTFATRLLTTLTESGQLCVGIDPHAGLLATWGLPDSAAGVREFGLKTVDAVAGRAGIVKPQVAFFERHGSAGYAALEEVLAAARAAGLFVIADAKRGDIGSTVDAYGEAWLSPGSPLEADAMTAYAYQGLGSLRGVLDLAEQHGKGVIVVTATSNPEAVATQTAVRSDGRTVAAGIAAEVATLPGTGGLVLGATIRLGDYGIAPESLAGIPILAPGFGAQGARLADLSALFEAAAPQVAAHVSREILGAGPDGIVAAIDRAQAELRALPSVGGAA
ncbi:orotidine-5'-phosphate decarboxylase [Pseudolysinimonas yzui]|uniref:Orotidine-5'-phosphate decarboxylase n=1 Tax=Pseudolysinimonas yzui TaxID=2708254 RepID=A0A8J3GNV7_9MICO|nr:orotidine-5'-phosphate decarboxylase [Pseudolysinimonas yzui]GHF08895.1 orotidine 5'-phosphate decarboxylase [Pseudolysinimonas yzui]